MPTFFGSSTNRLAGQSSWCCGCSRGFTDGGVNSWVRYTLPETNSSHMKNGWLEDEIPELSGFDDQFVWCSSCDYCWWSDSVMFQPIRISTGSTIVYPWKWKMGESPILLDLSFRVIFHWTNDYGRKGNTPRKNNGWTRNGGLVQMIFLFHWLTFGFPGCNGWLPNFFSLLLGWFCVSWKIEANS